jgi:hypothetical protein
MEDGTVGLPSSAEGKDRDLKRKIQIIKYTVPGTPVNEVVVVAILDCRRNPSWIRERLMKG